MQRITAIKLNRHSGMDRRDPDCRDANNLRHPWSLGSGGPCRNDGILFPFPRSSTRRYTQMQEARHFGRDAEIQRPGMAIYKLGWQPNRAYAYPSSYRPWPGYRHPCRYDGVFGSAGLVYNKARHFGRDAEIQRPRMAIYELGWQPNRAYAYPSSYRPWPGYRHPCRYDGVFGSAGLVYNDERSCVGMAIPTLLNHAADRRSGQALVPTQERGNQKKNRHTGMDAGIQAMDGNLSVVPIVDLGTVVRQSLPSMDAGFRHPCRNDGTPRLVYEKGGKS